MREILLSVNGVAPRQGVRAKFDQRVGRCGAQADLRKIRRGWLARRRWATWAALGVPATVPCVCWQELGSTAQQQG